MKAIDTYIDPITEAEIHLFVREMPKSPKILTTIGTFSLQEFVIMEYKRVVNSSFDPAWSAIFYEPTIDYIQALALFAKLKGEPPNV